MELNKKQLTTLFTLAAGLGFGAVTGVMNLMQDNGQNDNIPPPQTQKKEKPAAAVKMPATQSIDTIEATVTKVTGENVFHARMHTWVAQFSMVSVCVKDKVTAPKPCNFEARISNGKIAEGKTVLLKNIAPATGAISPHTIATDIPNIRPRQDILPGPVPARVVKLIDGDTVQIIAQPFAQHYVLTDIRIGDIDTPEKKGRAKCADEAALAAKASAATEQLVLGKEVFLYNVQFEKYGGRVLGDIKTADGISAAQNLIDKKLARPYDGGKKQSWCALK